MDSQRDTDGDGGVRAGWGSMRWAWNGTGWERASGEAQDPPRSGSEHRAVWSSSGLESSCPRAKSLGVLEGGDLPNAGPPQPLFVSTPARRPFWPPPPHTSG